MANPNQKENAVTENQEQKENQYQQESHPQAKKPYSSILFKRGQSKHGQNTRF